MEINEITEMVIGCAYEVGNTLGTGFLEKVYENALAHEIRKAGLRVLQQHALRVYYDDVIVGEFFADLLVQDKVLVELKVTESLSKLHMAQCLNYLKATNMKICLLINLGKPRVQIKRVVLRF
ncbi:MAG: GxxExxY protein [Anaerolineae bacterium]|nr:GxxExxY protein [Anaerolineae bacterium]